LCGIIKVLNGCNFQTSVITNSTSFLVPLTKTSNGQYIAYNKNAKREIVEPFECLIENALTKDKNVSSSAFRDANDQVLKTFRIAISTTGEYTNYWDDGNLSNGTAQEDALAQVVSTLNRVNEVLVRGTKKLVGLSL